MYTSRNILCHSLVLVYVHERFAAAGTHMARSVHTGYHSSRRAFCVSADTFRATVIRRLGELQLELIGPGALLLPGLISRCRNVSADTQMAAVRVNSGVNLLALWVPIAAKRS